MRNHLTDDLLFDYLDDVLDSAEKAQVVAHLDNCPACTERMAETVALFGEIEALPDVPLTRDLSAEIVERISAETELSTATRSFAVAQLAISIVALVFAWPLLQLLWSPLAEITSAFSLEEQVVAALVSLHEAEMTWQPVTDWGVPEVGLNLEIGVTLLLLTALLWMFTSRSILREAPVGE